MTHFSDGVSVGPIQLAYPTVPLANIAVYDVVPAALSATAVAAAQAVAGAGNLTLASATVTLDVPRAVRVVSSDAADTTQTTTIYGTDAYGQSLTETIALNGTTAVSGKKAFKAVTRVAVSGACAGNVSAGTSDVFGLPWAVASASYIFRAGWAGTLADNAGTLVAADATTATATTGDVRGTYSPSTAANGSRRLTIAAYLPNIASPTALYGVAQA